MTYRVLSLFAGIGGFDLGLERTGGFKTVAFCEIDPFCQKVLAKHWPGVPCYDDVRTLTAERLSADGIVPDVICGGFPCQDISFAGKGAGLAGERSGLFHEIARLAGELGPKFIILENVSALLSRGLGEVLGTLASLGYDAEWDCIPAAHIGAPHRRDRVWIIAYPKGDPFGSDANCAGPYRTALHVLGNPELRDEQVSLLGSLGEDVANTEGLGGGARLRETDAIGDRDKSSNCRGNVADAFGERRGEARGCTSWGWAAGRCAAVQHQWDVEPNVGRVAHGVPARVDRLRSLGNAVVPQIPELIGRAILAAEAA